MFILALDTCFASCSVALFDADAGQVIAARRAFMERGHAEALPPMAQEVMAGHDFKSLGAIAVTVGPGSFTGVRVGLAFAKGLALAWQTPLIGIGSLDATAAPALGSKHDVLVCHVAGASGFLYVQRVTPTGNANHVMLQIPDAIEVGPDHLVIGTGAALVANRGRRNSGLDLPDARLFVSHAAGLQRAHHGEVQPVYVRDAGAKPARPTVPAVEARFVTEADFPLMAKLHRASFDTPWSEEQFKAALALPGAGAIAVDHEKTMRGFLHFQIAADQAEIHTICVEPRWRRRGLGLELLKSLRVIVAGWGVGEIRLDVAADNAAALSLYGRCGYYEVGRRKAYYARSNGTADAILMTLKL